MTLTADRMEPAKSSDNSKEAPSAISQFRVHTFESEIMERKMLFQLVRMHDSILLYVNYKDQTVFNDLSLAMVNRYNNSPVGSRLMGDFNEEFSQGVACRLSKKLGKVVFLSLNVEQNKSLIPFIEKRIFEEINKSSDKF